MSSIPPKVLKDSHLRDADPSSPHLRGSPRRKPAPAEKQLEALARKLSEPSSPAVSAAPKMTAKLICSPQRTHLARLLDKVRVGSPDKDPAVEEDPALAHRARLRGGKKVARKVFLEAEKVPAAAAAEERSVSSPTSLKDVLRYLEKASVKEVLVSWLVEKAGSGELTPSVPYRGPALYSYIEYHYDEAVVKTQDLFREHPPEGKFGSNVRVAMRLFLAELTGFSPVSGSKVEKGFARFQAVYRLAKAEPAEAVAAAAPAVGKDWETLWAAHEEDFGTEAFDAIHFSGMDFSSAKSYVEKILNGKLGYHFTACNKDDYPYAGSKSPKTPQVFHTKARKPGEKAMIITWDMDMHGGTAFKVFTKKGREWERAGSANALLEIKRP